MTDEAKLKAYSEECKTFSDADLEFRSSRQGTPEYQKIALEEIHRRQKIKEQNTDDTQRTIKNLTIIIFILTFLTQFHNDRR